MPTGATELRKLAAIMFTDMVGYSALAQQNEALSLELLEEHRLILRRILPTFNGIEVKTIGDAFLFQFHSALEAVQCAVEIQRALAERNQDVPAERRIELKIGIHLGDVVHRDGDIYGDGVNIASRIEPLAGAGGICISQDIERQIRTKVGLPVERIGPKDLKNIALSMEVYRVVLPWTGEPPATHGKPESAPRKPKPAVVWAVAGLIVLLAALWVVFGSHLFRSPRLREQAGLHQQTGEHRRAIESIAVRPLQNFSHDPEQEYFVDGLTELLCADLAGISGLKKVTSRTTVMQYKNTTNTAQQIAAQLGVDALIEGSVQRESNRVLVTVQLIEGATDRHLWGTNYRREITSVLELKSELAEAIAREVKVRLTPEEQSRFDNQHSVMPGALDAYLRGRYYIENYKFDLVKPEFEKAIAIDPSYARGWAALAGCYMGSAFVGQERPLPLLQKVKEYSEQALKLDPLLPEGLQTAAWAKMMLDWDWEETERLLRRSIQANKSDSGSHIALGFILTALGRYDEAYAEMKRGQELDPFSWSANVWLMTPLVIAGKLDAAIEEASSILQRNTNFFPVLEARATAYALQGKYDDALKDLTELQSHPQISPRIPALIGYIHAKAGKTQEANRILDEFKSHVKDPYVPAMELATVCIGLGQKQEALAWLNRAFEDRAGPIYWLKVNPLFAELRNEPDFRALLKKMNLVPLP